MEDLFTTKDNVFDITTLPLAARMRPQKMEDFVGQDHIAKPGKLLRRIINADRITSIVFFGPPGSGKTTLAHIIAKSTQSHFAQLSAVESNVSDIRRTISEAKNRLAVKKQKTLLFIDEIHRFNKAQQDTLLPDIENRTIEFIGATTHNPFFSIIAPLLSRSHIFELHSLKPEDLSKVIQRAIADKKNGFGNMNIKIDDDALSFWTKICDGDARKVLNTLEIAVLTTEPTNNKHIHITLDVASESIQKKAVLYDHDEDGHYDTISAFIKSLRGSDPDAALYWLAKMIYAGEDPAFIARRLVISASEDVGNADPRALTLATAALHSVQLIGMPEARITLAQAATYIACAPKSNAAYLGIDSAISDVEKGKILQVPNHLKDSSYKSAKKLGHGVGYAYSHNGPKHYVQQKYMPEEKKYYNLTDLGYEKKMKQWMEEIKK